MKHLERILEHLEADFLGLIWPHSLPQDSGNGPENFYSEVYFEEVNFLLDGLLSKAPYRSNSGEIETYFGNHYGRPFFIMRPIHRPSTAGKKKALVTSVESQQIMAFAESNFKDEMKRPKNILVLAEDDFYEVGSSSFSWKFL